MCGFSGLLIANHQHSKSNEWKNHFAEASKKIAHRGSDDARMVNFNSVLLHHFRLAFQDLSSGRQPMLSRDGSRAIIFNGEIYNHFELRRELEKHHGPRSWRTHSDTETILEGWILEGEAFADRLEGEFAFVIVRTDGTEFFAARDKFGVKPLFLMLAGINTRLFSEAQKHYSIEAPVVAFASEMKALPGRKIWNRDGALRQFVGLFEPLCTPFEEIIQCPPGGRIIGHLRSETSNGRQFRLRISTRDHSIRTHERRPFWSSENLQNELNIFRESLASSVEERLLSDVELGVYLSGGIDSKVVAYELSRILKNQNSPWLKNSLKSFTLGFESAGYDESQEATEFSRYLGFTPHVLRLSVDAMRYSYPHAVYISENLQPYTNGAAKWWLSLFARQYVPGVLTGDGADEILCGYPSFRYCAWWSFANRGRDSTKPLGGRWRDGIFIKKFRSQSADPWLAGSSAEGNGEDFEASLSLWNVAHPLFGQIYTITESILGADEAKAWLAAQGPSIRSWFTHGLADEQQSTFFTTHPENALFLWQNYFCHTHLPVQVLNWVGDRMEMANTLEGRTPFLSGHLSRFVAQLPNIALVQGFLDKAILRKAYARELPRQFVMTPKKQFNAPFLNFETLYHDYDAADLLDKMGILTHGKAVASRLLQNTKQDPQKIGSAHERYQHTHQLSALQTLICGSIVQRTIVEMQSPKRDPNIESQILSKGGPLS